MSLMNRYATAVTVISGPPARLPAAGRTRVEIFNILGQKVRDLVDRELAAGRHQVAWDGTNGRGRIMPSGVYLYRILAGDFVESKKMVLLK